MAYVVGRELWSLLDAALARLERWRSHIFKTEPPDANTSLVNELCQNQAVFNGFGKHFAVDFLHEQCLWPGMPLYAPCVDDGLFLTFKEGHVAYMRRWMAQEYRKDCLAGFNLEAPFAYNHTGDQRYMCKYA